MAVQPKIRCPYNGRHWTANYTTHIGGRECARTAYCDKCDKAFFEKWSTSVDVSGYGSLHTSWYEMGKDWYLGYMNNEAARPHDIQDNIGYKLIKKAVHDID